MQNHSSDIDKKEYWEDVLKKAKAWETLEEVLLYIEHIELYNLEEYPEKTAFYKVHAHGKTYGEHGMSFEEAILKIRNSLYNNYRGIRQKMDNK